MWGPRRERTIVGVLATAAGIRVLLFAWAFPFFTNVDEHRHVDMVLKYARGYVPRPGTDAYEPRTSGLIALLASPEYAAQPGSPPQPPVWDAAPGAMAGRLRQSERLLSSGPNLEAFQPPVYYATAGAVFAAAGALGLESAPALYSVRALGAVFVAALAFAAWLLLRESHPDDALVRIGVPALLVAFPIDTFYYVTPDALSPLTAGVAFVLVLKAALRPEARAGAFALAGGAVALALLTKYTNVFLLGVVVIATALAGRRAPRRFALLWAALALPFGLWLARNAWLFGELTASGTKLEYLGWGRKSLSAWWEHPLFSASGLVEFVTGLIPMFWRGEIVWNRVALAHPAADAFYIGVTLTALALAAIALPRRRGATRLVEGASLAAVVLAGATLAVLSLAFEFGEGTNPPAAHPFFIHGRLISGALLPFLVVLVRGVRVATAPLPARVADATAVGALALISAVCLVSEVTLSLPVFASAYNLYHLP
jgi:hypothetical protein